MTQLSMNELTTYRWSFEEDVQHYVRAGFSAIGVWRQKLADYGEERGIDLLREARLAVSSLLWAGGFTGSDGRSHRDSIEDALDAVRLAAQLESATLIVHTGPRAGHTHNHARRLVRSALVDVAQYAEELGVTLALEPMHPGCAGEWTFLTTLEQASELAGEIASPALKLVADTYHLCQGGIAPLEQGDLVGQLALVQLGDARTPPEGEQNRCPLGEGKIPLRDAIEQLRRGGYRGYWEIELLGEDVETADYGELLAQSRSSVCQWLEAGRKIA